MSMISEQVKELRTIANNLTIGHNMPISLAIERFRQAADTIEALSAKMQAANMENGGGWIACEDRLPGKYCHCLVTRRNDYEDGFDTDVKEDVWIELEGVWDWQSKHEGLIDNIIAWQPLPEPYRP